MLHGWYSDKQAELYGTVMYERPNGQLVAVSMVSSDPNPAHGWDDMQYIGLVERYHSGRLKERVNLEDRSNKP